MSSPSKRVLVIRLSSLGDVVLTGPVFRNIKTAWPDSHVAALVKPQYAPVLESQPGVDEIIPFTGFLAALRTIQAGGFTHLLDLHGTFRSFWLRTLSGVPTQVCYRKDALARRLFVWLRQRGPGLEKHVLERYLDALAEWDIPAAYRKLELPPVSGPSAAPRHTDPAPGNIVVMQTAFLGDAALTLPLLKSLRRRFPSARLTIVTRPDTAEIFRGSVDEILPDDKRGAGRGLGGFSRLVHELKARAFDLAIVPHRSLRSALLAWSAGIPQRVGFDSSVGQLLFTKLVPFSWLMHDLERNLSLVGAVGGPAGQAEAAETHGSLSAAGPGTVKERLRTAGRDALGPLIGIHPGSVWPTKRWLPERFAALIGRLASELHASVVLVGGKSDRELAETIRQASGAGERCLNWTGETTLPELIELMRELSLFVTNDSGPMHVATASGVPTLALFGPTTRELGFFPYGPGHRVLEKDLACRPCGLHGAKECPEGHFLCMRLITTDEAFAAAKEMLQLSNAPAAGRRP